ncbi:hypothetical protein OH76DRAFT_731018 [Lentinus brumalis]|uniref:Uncharacterized protein n=1 Tax=Lentinus brumalis TaxID=2498619 RepID=A0A371DS21_9APHY|nr:hypothetical protein OH76DRAFT_731018 [Polyporus brumalis]
MPATSTWGLGRRRRCPLGSPRVRRPVRGRARLFDPPRRRPGPLAQAKRRHLMPASVTTLVDGRLVPFRHSLGRWRTTLSSRVSTMSAVALWPHRVQETCGVPDVEQGAVTHCRQVQCPSFRPLSGRASGTCCSTPFGLSAEQVHCRLDIARVARQDAICVRACVCACEERSAHDQALGRRRGAAGSWNAMACIECTAHVSIEADSGNSYSLRGCSYS